MSSIRKRKGKWFVEIRKKYFKPIRKTFEYKLDAEKFAREKQSEIDKGFLISFEQAQSTKLGELLERYRLEITSKKKGATVEDYKIKFLSILPIIVFRVIGVKSKFLSKLVLPIKQ